MSDKMECPACESVTSDVLRAFKHGYTCPHCKLSAEAAEEIFAARKRYREGELVEQLKNAIVSNDSLRAQLAEAHAKLAKIKLELETDQVRRW